MHPLALLVLVASCAGTVHALPPAAAGTPAGHFWAEALPGTPMPKAISDLVQKGIDHPPLEERYDNSGDAVVRPPFTFVWGCVGGCPDKSEVPRGLIFHREQVRVGSIMTVALPPEAPPAILPQAVSEKIPLGNNPADVLAMFGIAPNSTAAAMVADTLRRCHAPAPSDEQKACTTSLESTVKTAIDMLGASRRRASVLVSELSRDGLPLQQYQVQAVSPVHSNRYVGCHVMHYLYAVYFCHTMTTAVLPHDEAYVISLRGLSSNGPAIDMAAICHLDTSKWNPANPAFEILHTHPGIPVCHFLQYANMLFVDKTANA